MQVRADVIASALLNDATAISFAPSSASLKTLFVILQKLLVADPIIVIGVGVFQTRFSQQRRLLAEMTVRSTRNLPIRWVTTWPAAKPSLSTADATAKVLVYTQSHMPEQSLLLLVFLVALVLPETRNKELEIHV